MRRFFYDTTASEQAKPLAQTGINQSVNLTDDITHHWCRVLRAKIGERGVLFDGLGGEYQVELTQIQKKSATATILSYHKENNTPNFISQISLVMSRGERMDYAIQKATELGVTTIQLLSSQHGEVKLKPAQVDKKLHHWQQIALSACEQCGLNTPPIIYAPLSINEWLKNNAVGVTCDYMLPIVNSTNYPTLNQASEAQDEIKANIKLVLSVPRGNLPRIPSDLPQILNNKDQTPFIKLLIGPEGGLSKEEISQAEDCGWQAWQIGNRIMRTETAPVVALATLQAWSNTNI